MIMKTKYFLSLSLIFLSIAAIAQPPPPPATPIDGGLGILLAGGAVYGIKKLSSKLRK